jgi:hypothetical protein
MAPPGGSSRGEVRGDRVMGVVNLIFAPSGGSCSWPRSGSGVAEDHGRKARTGRQPAVPKGRSLTCA